MYVATINIPGYLPELDPAEFETAQEAWSYLSDERERAEDEYEGDEYSETARTLLVLGRPPFEQEELREYHVNRGLNPDGTGTIYGDTPGYEGSHDLGIAYTVLRSQTVEKAREVGLYEGSMAIHAAIEQVKSEPNEVEPPPVKRHQVPDLTEGELYEVTLPGGAGKVVVTAHRTDYSVDIYV